MHSKQGEATPDGHGERSQTPRGPLGSWHWEPASVQTLEGPWVRTLASQAPSINAINAMSTCKQVDAM